VQRLDGLADAVGAPAGHEVESPDRLRLGNGWIHAGRSFDDCVQVTSIIDAGAAGGNTPAAQSRGLDGVMR